MTKPRDPWWWPEFTDDAWIARIRDDYPEECEGMDAEDIRDHFADGWKYADVWDHLEDARAQFEALADAYLALVAKHPEDDPRNG